MSRAWHLAMAVIALAVGIDFVAAPAAAEPATLDAPANRWQFDPSIGLEGRGSVVGTGGSRLEMECGNGGAPVFWFEATPRPRIGEDKRVTLVMDVDGDAYDHRFDCGNDAASCMSDAFPDPALVAALRRGSTLTLVQESAPIAAFSLAGSDAAISRLRNCLSY